MILPERSLQIEPMQPADIEAVGRLERAAYGRQWSGKDYERELLQSKLAHYYVLRIAAPSPRLLGQGGFWFIIDEVHISTIAIHPEWRRLGLGERLLIHLLEQGRALGATMATLEVRPSNTAAISLYHKYGFQEVGRRPAYYHDGEDALLLTNPDLTSPDHQALFDQGKAALRNRLC